jgi:photosystem II stability/assembly factor-like uncharacterized protein
VKCFPIAVRTSDTLYAVSFVDAEIVIAAGASGALLRSTDAGRSWQGRARPTDSTVFALAFAERVGIAVGSGGTLLRTEDAAETWARLRPLGRAMLHGVSLHPSGFGVAGETSGSLWITRDLGLSWERRRLWNSAAIRRVQVVSSEEAWAVGDEGLVLVSRDRGRRWKRLRRTTREDLLGVHFSAPNLGWAVGRYGTILRTEDGGLRWHPQCPEHRQRDFYAVCFASAEEGWIVGGGRGTFYAPIEHTADGGAKWTSIHSGTTDSLFDLACSRTGVVCAVGRYGRIVRLGPGARKARAA